MLSLLYNNLNTEVGVPGFYITFPLFTESTRIKKKVAAHAINVQFLSLVSLCP